jgi:DNA-binding beta-propeller fold protein YncE
MRRWLALALLLAPWTAWADTAAGGPPQAPILRIEAGGPTGAVTHLAVDAAGTLMALVSYDKTVRLYSLPDDVARGVLRPPIGPDHEGELYAVAMSPDGKTVFAAGATGGSWDGRFCLYMFNVAAQRLQARLSGFESPVNDLAVSPDGTRLGVGLAKGGILVFDARSGAEVYADPAILGPVRNLRFDKADRLFVASADGRVRGYSAAGRKFASVAPEPGLKPWGLAVSPDGGFVAVTFDSAPVVDVLESGTLKQFFKPDVSGLPDDGFLAVDWAVKGGGVSLLAGGYARSGGKNMIAEWGDFGLGAGTTLLAAADTVRDIKAVPGGGAVYATEDPGWGRIGPDGKIALAPVPAVADLRGARNGGLAVSADGAAVIFDAGGSLYKFDSAARRLTPAAAIDPAFAAARTDGLDVRDWEDTDQPSLNGTNLALDQAEYSRSLAVLAGGQRFLLGTDTHVRLYDASGRLLGSVPVDAAAWAVTVSADGQIAVAALLDGTLRWFGIGPDGTLTPRATLFAAADEKRWVLFTPDGFFDEADLGGQNLVGFHVNLGADQQPEWVSFGQGFRLFYAPAVVTAALAGNTAPAVAAAQAIGDLHDRLIHEPTIAVQSACVGAGDACRSITVSSASDVAVPDDAEALTLGIQAHDRGLGVGVEDVFVNGRNAGRLAAPTLVNGVGQTNVSVPLDPGPNQIVVRQYDAGDAIYAESPPLTISRTDASAAPAAAGGSLYVLAIGIDHFAAADPSLTLHYAVSDATSFADLVSQAAAPVYAHAHVTLLTEGQATKAGILAALAAVAKQAQPGDTFLFYIASHGGVNSTDGQFLLVPQDIKDLSSWATIEQGAVTEGALVSALAAIRARDTLLFIDTCYSGAVSAANLANVGQESGRYIISASSSAQEALDSYNGKDGVLIYALREAFDGDAPHDSSGVIGALSLGEYISERVGELARQRNHAQDAAFTAAQSQLNSFPVAKVQGGL